VQLQLSGELRQFQDEVVAWIHDHAPRGLSELADWSTPWGNMGQYQQVVQGRRHELYAEWERVSVEGRMVCPQWPEWTGGRGWDAARTAIFDIALHEANVPRISRGFGEWLVGPSLLLEGTPEQQQAFLPPIVSGRDVYCQGFSEPNHGSDLAAVETRGVVDGDEIVVTGQKVWTSDAVDANMIFVLCRTDPQVRKHAGLSFVLIPFTAENKIEVRPILMINGVADFCEDFLDGARAPLFNVIGGLNNGWRVAMTALSYERGAGATTQHLSYLPEFWALVDQARKRDAITDPQVRQRLAWAYTNVELMRYAGLQSMSRLLAGREPGVVSSVNKLHWSEYQRELGEFAIELDDDFGLIRPDGPGYPLTRWQDLYLSSRGGTIYSGTSEIQRNIIAERVLGLPKEPRVNG
jgi:alkylation response protein AidB-like acyl-CoA dehydrogenase